MAASVRTVTDCTPRSTLAGRLLSALSCVFLLGSTAIAAPQVDRDFGKVPLSFEPNHGQTDPRVQYLSRGQGYSLLLTADEATLALKQGTLAMKLAGANHNAASQPQDKLPGSVNYFEGKDQSKWLTALPTYKRVAYTGVYPGVDLVYYGNQRELEYDFIVAPGANPQKIALTFEGATPTIDRTTGDLVLAGSDGQTRFHKPVIYQLDGNRHIPVAGSYAIAGKQVHFALGSYDHARSLVIDPVLSYMTYISGTDGDDAIHGMAVDAQGNVIIVGTTYSTNFPLKNAYSSVPPLDYRTPTMYVSKFNPTGTALVYSTFLGVSTQAAGVAIDPTGNAYVFATTNDPNYPVTPGAFQNLCGANYAIVNNQGVRANGCSATSASGNNSTAITKISPDGQKLLYSTYLSGNNGNTAIAIAVNAAGEAYVVGQSNAYCPTPPYNANGTGYQAYSCFPVTANGAESSVMTTDSYAFLTKLNAQGTGLVYGTVIRNHNPVGHSLSQIIPYAIALDTAGNAYVTGHMDANYFINTTPFALQPARSTSGNSLPAFVAKFNPAGTAVTSLVYSTYLTGTSDSSDSGNGIAADTAGNAYVTGYTNSCTFPTTAGAFATLPNGNNVASNICAGGFLTKLNPAGSALVWSTFTGNRGTLGGTNDNNDAVALGGDGSVYTVADINGVSLYPTLNPILKQSESHYAALKRFSADGSQILLSTAIGGTTDAASLPVGVFVDAANNIYMAGSTSSFTWPTTPGVFQATNNHNGGGSYVGFVVKIAPLSTTTTALTLPTGTVTAGQSVKLTAKVTGQTGTTGIPTGTVTFLNGTNSLGTGTLDSTGATSYSSPSVNSTTYTYTASYGGDSAFAASISAPQTLVVTPATPTVTLTAPSSALVGAPVTLSVAVTGTAATPTGTVLFRDGTATLSTATLASGAATFTTSALTTGPHTITVSYSGDAIYAATVSATSTVTINVVPAITYAATPTSLTIVHGNTGNVTITGTPVGGYTGTSSFTCGALPAGASCSFSPTSLTFTGNNSAQSVVLTVGTVITAANDPPRLPGQVGRGIVLAVLILPIGWAVGRRKTRAAGQSLLLLFLITASVALVGLTGCANGTFAAKATTTTAAGTYSIPVTVTSAGSSTTLNVPLTVQ